MRKAILIGGCVALAACSHPAPQPVPEVAADTDVAPAPVIEGPPAVRPLIGTWRVTTNIASRRNTAAANRPGTVTLSGGVSSSPDGYAAVQPQYTANANIPGYAVPTPARARGRRAAQSIPATPTTWWPARGDSVIIHVIGAGGNRIQLRGVAHGRTMRGEVWLLSLATGNTIQLGNFTATKTR